VAPHQPYLLENEAEWLFWLPTPGQNREKGLYKNQHKQRLISLLNKITS